MKTKSYAFYLILALFVANIFTLNAQTGAALDFDGTDDYCVLANNSTLNVTQFTIETWVKWTRLASNVDFVCGKGFEQMEIHLNTNNSIRFIPVAGIYLDAPANTLPLNVWTHLACVYNPSTGLAKMYINGAEVVLTHNGSNPLTTPLTDNTQGMTLGIRSPSVYPLQGQLDEFRLWNRALTQAEIQSRMSCEIPTTSSELIVNLHFNQGTAAGSNTGVTSATDASGNSNNFTLTNFTLLGSTSNWVTTGTGVAAISLKGTPTGCGSVNLTASGGTSYAWSSGETTPSATFTTVGTYGVTVTVTNGCTVSALTQTVAVASTPNAVITGTTSDCSSVILTASGGTTYLWNGGSTPNNATNTFTSSGTYTVTVTSSSCPTASATAMATVNITGPTRIYVNAAATGANNGTSWNDAFTSLQSALTTCLQPNGEIWVAKGTYKPSAAPTVCSACSASQNYTFHIKKTMKVYGSFAGTETSLAERTPSVMSANQTILSGDIGTIGVNTDNTFHVVYIVANTVTFDGFKVVDGYALSGAYPIINGNAAYGAFGGGVYVSFSSAVTLSNLILSNNSAMASGSGVDVEFSSNTLIDNCTFSNNSGSALDFFYALGTIISNCKFISNAAPSGGGIKTNAGESLTINNCVFSDNVATAYGGGISVDGGGVLTIKNTVFNNNRADRGGGIYKQQGSSLINLTNCSLVNNQATTSGGGINASSHSSITILNSIFWGNTAPTVPQFSNATVTYSIYPSSFDATNSSSDPLFQNLSDPDGADNIWEQQMMVCNSPATHPPVMPLQIQVRRQRIW